MKGKNSFVGLNARNVLGQVGRLGEEIAAMLLKGDIVSDEPFLFPFADVVNPGMKLAAQVKMCNGRHAQRPLPQQVCELHDEIQHPFLFSRGVYVFIFYDGVVGWPLKNPGKSKIWSRKFSRERRRDIISRELQYVYIVDVRLLRSMIDQPRFIKADALVSEERHRASRKKVLYLTRTTMKRFLDLKTNPSYTEMLNVAIGKGRWNVKTMQPEFKFVEGFDGPFQRRIPVHVIGSRKVVADILSILKSRLSPISLGNKPQPQGVLVPAR